VLNINKEENECPLTFTVSKGEPGWVQYSVAAEGCRQVKENGVDSSPL
jgi:hypothetical protein